MTDMTAAQHALYTTPPEQIARDLVWLGGGRAEAVRAALDAAHPSRGVVDEGMVARAMDADAEEYGASIPASRVRRILEAAALPADHTTEARTLEAVRAKLSPSEWAILCVAFQDHHAAAASKVHAALPAVPSEFMGWVHEVVWVDGTSRDLRQKEPTMLDDSPGLISQRVVRVFADPLAATPAHDQPEGEG